jgi:hypothetical protein
MKKTFVWAMAATLVAGAAFAGTSLNSTRYAIQPNATFAGGAPATTNNDDSCDITTSPAATLLLPHFEVDYVSSADAAVNTNFTITNTSNTPQIAHVTLWTDWSYPVLDFNIFLTGYDVQGINLYDIINRGLIPGTSIGSARGARSLANTANFNFQSNVGTTCANLPGPIGDTLRNAIQAALTTGDGTFYLCDQIGGEHTNAEGYVTVDVSSQCSQTLPTEAGYYSNEILYDNTLIGDYQRIDPRASVGNYAGGNPMVHIKAIPEGGAAGAAVATNLPWTFYSRYSQGVSDRRQPLPNLFAARYIQGGTGSFNTQYAVWREGFTSGATTNACDLGDVPSIEDNGSLPITEIVRFDEAENPNTSTLCRVSPCPRTRVGSLPETSNESVGNTDVFPPSGAGVAGWMYLNLNNNPTGSSPREYPAVNDPSGAYANITGDTRPSQNWVIVQMTAEGRYGVDFDAAYLGNGCGAAVASGATINPYGGVCASAVPCPTINNTP